MNFPQLHASFREAWKWVDTEFRHFARINPGRRLNQFLTAARVELIECLTLRDGERTIAQYSEESQDVFRFDRELIGQKTPQERVAISIHEITEGFGIDLRLFSGWGFDIIRPEHDYAEYVETFYREQFGLPPCELALDEPTWARMEKMDRFFRRYREHRVPYLGDKIDTVLRNEPGISIDDSLRDRIKRMGIIPR